MKTIPKSIRLTEVQYRSIKRAAKKLGISSSDLIRMSALEAAKKINQKKEGSE